MFMMISRALFVALSVAYTTSLAPLTGTVDDDCALYLTGPGRSSAYDYSLNLLKGNFVYDNQHTCITYEAINQAYLDARNRILVSQPKGDWKAEDFASAGELILDISINLARTYGLTYEEIEKGLPLIDTSRTLIREVCPPVFSHVECRAGKYRRLDGLCNNLKHPTWGATMAPFQRLIGPLFADGINAPRISHTGHDLPLSRVVSRTMHPDDGFHDHAGTVMVIAWGQFMDHDYTLTGTPLDPIHRNDPEECCKRPPHLKHPYCNEIRVPDDDYFYRLFGVKCIDFVRGFPSPRPGCRLGSRVPFNTLTGAIDGNTVYGVTEKFSRKLRTGYGGLLRMNPVFKEYGLKDLLPLKLDIPDEGCTRPNKNMYCFEAGEIRVNEQLVLTVMHTLMAREHNRVAEALAVVNPHWDDETLFQESRRINIAEIQHITYNEFLPILLGKDVMEKFGLVLAKEGYWDGYDQEVNPDVIASFASAAYRFGHSLLPTAVERWSKAHKFIASKRLSDLIRRPYDLYRAGVLDEYVMGLMNQVAQAMDDSITQEVTNHLFKKVGARFGMDLVSFNMQRGREFGIPGYMEFRKFCGLSGANSFQDLFGSMPNETINKYETIFEHPIDVDLWSGGVSERPLPGSMLGPTFACIIATQFSYSRRGDRFWFELPHQPSSFTPEQLAEIRKSRLARIICDNTDIIDTVQLYPMVLPDHELNPRVPCRSGIIPSMDFSKWADPVPLLGGVKEYMTDAFICNETEIANNQFNKICDNITNENCNVNNNLKSILKSNCNDTNHYIISQNLNNTNNLFLCLHKENDTVSLNNMNNTISNGEDRCKNETSYLTKNVNNTTVKQNPKSNIILEYILKDGKSIKIKAQGHFKNTLKRKKRSSTTDIDEEDEPLTSEYFSAIDDELKAEKINLPRHSPDEIVKTVNLADFKIETLHENKRRLKDNLRRRKQRFHNTLKDGSYLPKSIKTYKERSKNIAEDKIDNNTNNLRSRKLKQNDESDENNSDKENITGQVNKNNNGRGENIKKDGSAYETESDDILQNNKNNHHLLASQKRNADNDENNKNIEDNSYQENDDDSNINTEADKNVYTNKELLNKKLPRENIRFYNDKIDKQPAFESIESEELNLKKNTDEVNTSHLEAEINDESDENLKRGHEPHEFLPSYSNFRVNTKNDNNNIKKENLSSTQDTNETNNEKYIENTRNVGDSDRNVYPSEYLNTTNVNPHNDQSEILFNTYEEKQNVERYNKPDEINSFENSNIQRGSNEDSDENVRQSHLLNVEYNHVPKIRPRPTDSDNIHDIDLTDLSHERININNDGKLELTEKIHENDDADLIKTTSLQNIGPNKQSSSEHNVNSFNDIDDNNNSKEIPEHEPKQFENQININDGEVKPVIELNNEESEESSEEELRSKSEEISETNSKLNSTDENILLKGNEKIDVKQQFERIPVNYNHAEANPNITESALSDNNHTFDATIDNLSPENKRYDENLNIKFGDVSINLPEIKLPEDILAFADEDPTYETDNDKPKHNYYDYDNEDADKIKNKEDKNNDKYDFFASYINKPEEINLQGENLSDEEGEDLYEKFVRERFGKKKSFNEKSEKLQDSKPKPNDKKLYKTIQTALKKAKEVEKEAEKSGDPEASYLWTLEYGEKL